MTTQNKSNQKINDESEQLDSKSAMGVAGIAIALAAGPLVMLYLLAQVVNPSTSMAGGGESEPAKIADRLRPVARFELIPAIKGPQTGQQVFEGLCTSCHTAGANGAPKIGAAGEWAPRMGQGFATLLKHGIEGYNGKMPARGGNPKLSDLEVARAIVYMTSKSGGSFPEPVDPAASKDAKADPKAATAVKK